MALLVIDGTHGVLDKTGWDKTGWSSMKGYLRIKYFKVFGVPVFIHWSALLVVGGLLVASVNSPVLGIITISSYFSVILLHEAGHAYFAKKLGYDVYAIYLGFFHGLCEYEAPENTKHESIVAWGGVSAQFLVAIPVIALAQFANLSEIWGFGPIVAFLGYISVIVALTNLAPSPLFDGGKAWTLIPILLKARRTRTRKTKNKAKRSKFKIVK